MYLKKIWLLFISLGLLGCNHVAEVNIPLAPASDQEFEKIINPEVEVVSESLDKESVSEITVRPVESIVKKSNLRTVVPAEFLALSKTGKYQVIDVRTIEELRSGTIFSEVLNIDYYKSNFKTKLDKLPKDQPYLIYCRAGVRSGKTLKIMEDLGFQNVADLRGGKTAWDKTFR